MDKYRIDSHKLMFHTERVSSWKWGQHIYPIYVEISPSGMCNHRCTFCAVDFMGYKNRFLDTEKTLTAIRKMAEIGVKAIMFGGEGEPLLHKDIDRIVRYARFFGIDVGITTNGSALGAGLSESLIPASTWIKVSLNAGNEEDYHKIHKADHWDRVWNNLKEAIRIRKELQNAGKHVSTIGVQAVLVEENYKSIGTLVETAKKNEIDYVVIKPFSQHPASLNKKSVIRMDEHDVRFLLNLKSLHETENFKVIIRERAINRKARSYQTCHALPFWSYIDSGGDVWCCSAMMPDEKFRIGNIYKDDHRQIWSGVNLPKINTKNCRVNCRMEECNEYLEEIKNPGAHVNFI